MRRKMKEVNYDTLGHISQIISAATHMVHSLKEALELKGCALLLLNRRSKKLEAADSAGLSHRPTWARGPSAPLAVSPNP